MREMSVAGSFYPSSSNELLQYIEHFTTLYDENFTLPQVKSKAVIVPHAGYVYSGFTANAAYRVLKQSGIKNFVVIGPSHKVAFDGISISQEREYATPLGNLQNSPELLEELHKEFDLKTLIPHNEHSTEVQFPFLKHYIPDAKIVELIYGRVNTDFLSKIINFVYEKEDWGVVISTDLSHFYTLDKANEIDTICINSIKNLDLKELNNGCEACGILGVESMLKTAQNLKLNAMILDYRTSADTSGDETRVVGYVSSCFV